MLTNYENNLFMAKMAIKMSTLFRGFKTSFVSIEGNFAGFLVSKTPECKEDVYDLIDAFVNKTYIEKKEDGVKYCIHFYSDMICAHCFEDKNLFFIKVKFNIMSSEDKEEN